MPQSHADLIRRFAEGPAVLQTALDHVPRPVMQWRPAPGKWSVHEIIIHCADSEANGHMRIRYLLAEAEPLIVGYDQDAWARHLDYHALPLKPALATIAAVRANTVPLLENLSESDWKKSGRHTEHPSYGVEQWMELYADHLAIHARQIQRNMAAWEAAK